MSTSPPDARPNLYLRCLVAWVTGVSGRPVLTLLLVGVTALVAAAYAYENVRMNSDNTKLVRQDAKFRQDYKAYLDSFPQFNETTVLVLSGDSIDVVSDAQERLAEALGQRQDLVSYVYAPGTDPYFEDHAFLYLDETELEETVDRLLRGQPALAALSRDPSLRGLFGELQLGFDSVARGEEAPAAVRRLSATISDVGESMLAGRPQELSWSDEFFGGSALLYRVIIIQGRADFGEPVSARRLIEEVRQTASLLGLTPESGVTLRLTGMVPLAHEELETLRSGIAVAGAVSAVSLIIILGFGLRSLRILVSTLLALAVSLAWTTAYAMATVGEFNTISAAFAVLLLGLGVDFGIHVGLRYEEETYRGVPVRDALAKAATGTGGAISLCALTSAIGFAAFVPTDYRGLAALGTIAAGGMLFSLIASFTVIPALLSLLGPPSHYDRGAKKSGSLWEDAIAGHSRAVVVAAAVIALVSAFLAWSFLSFDFSTLAMKDKASEGMVTLGELQEQGIVTDYSLTALAPDRASAEALAARLEALPEVSEARPPSSYLPEQQDEKRAILEEASFFLDNVLHPPPPTDPPSDSERLEALVSLRESIDRLPEDNIEPRLATSTQRLAAVLDGILDGPAPASSARELEALVTGGIADRLDWLRRAIAVGPVAFEDLPTDLRARVVDAEGRHSVVALPAGDMTDAVQLRAFVEAVTRVAPHATGRPSVEAGIGTIVVGAFRLAIGLAFAAISVLLLLSLRSVVDAVMVLAPITLAALMTVAVGIAADVPFTMANVVAIPLVLGLGVDSGIHVFMRYRTDGAFHAMMQSSTPRAVLLSSLTTLAAFGSLSLLPHPGLAGLGGLLSVSVIALLICTLIVLPAMIQLRERWQQRSAAR